MKRLTSHAHLKMNQRWAKALTEAVMIVAVASVLGLTTTAITAKGLFQSSSPATDLPNPKEDAVPTLTFEEAREIYLQGGAIFIDARHAKEYKSGHIKGAINVPLSSFRKSDPALTNIPARQPIVTYCNGTNCSSSTRLAQALRKAGYSNVKAFFGGWKEWQQNKQPVEP